MKIQIEATLIPVACGMDQTMRAGDKLIIVNGVCIGVQAAEDIPPPTPPRTHSPVEADVAGAIEKLRAAKQPTNAFRIASMLGLEREDKDGRSVLSQTLQRMKSKGTLKAVSESRVPDYELIPS